MAACLFPNVNVFNLVCFVCWFMQVHGENDPYFDGKRPLNLHGRDVKQSCNGLFWSALSHMPRNRYILFQFFCYIFTKKTYFTDKPASCTDWLVDFVLQICQKHVKYNISKALYIHTFTEGYISVYKPSVFFL